MSKEQISLAWLDTNYHQGYATLKTIAEVSPELLSFIEALQLPLSKPQKQHVAQVADALITTEGDKNLSALYRNIVGDPCRIRRGGVGAGRIGITEGVKVIYRRALTASVSALTPSVYQ